MDGLPSSELLALTAEHFARGWCVVRDALPAATVSGFVEQLARELEHPTVAPEYDMPSGIRLDDRASWPTGAARRVFPINPPGAGAHWDALGARATRPCTPCAA